MLLSLTYQAALLNVMTRLTVCHHCEYLAESAEKIDTGMIPAQINKPSVMQIHDRLLIDRIVFLI